MAVTRKSGVIMVKVIYRPIGRQANNNKKDSGSPRSSSAEKRRTAQSMGKPASKMTIRAAATGSMRKARRGTISQEMSGPQ